MTFLKNLVALLILGLILLFAAVIVVNVFWSATPGEILATIGGTFLILLTFAAAIRLFHRDDVRQRKAANDEYGHAIWLKAEAERRANTVNAQPKI